MMYEIFYFSEDGIVLSKYDVNMIRDNVWYFDNGVSNYMSGDKRYFRIFDDIIIRKVKFEDDLRIDIKGKGFIKFIDRNSELRMMIEVYYIFDLKSNIIFFG